MKKETGGIDTWSELYLDVVETLYGDLELHPDQTTLEVCEEWQRNFSLKDEVSTELDLSVQAWSESYLDVMEMLYGSFNLHPQKTTLEVCEEWQRCFATDNDLRSTSKSTKIPEPRSPSAQPLKSAS